MSAPIALTVPIILESAKLAQGYAAIDRAKKQFLYGGIVNNLMPEKIYLIRKGIQKRYDINPTDSTLTGTADYLWSLLGIYGLRALNALGQGGGEVIIIPTGSGGTVISIAAQIVELIVGDASQANPVGSPTPADGDMVVTLNYKVLPNSENIFYQGVPVRLYPANDFNYIPIYGSTTTTYTFSQPLTDLYSLKFDFFKITSESNGGTGTIGNGLQAVYVASPTTGNTLTVVELGTFMFASVRGATYSNNVNEITQSGTSLDFTNVGGTVAGEVYLIFYYPSLV